jgi:hypothetical protein
MKNQKKLTKRTYKLTNVTIEILETMTKRLSKEAGIEIAMGKVLELIILKSKDTPLRELLTEQK